MAQRTSLHLPFLKSKRNQLNIDSLLEEAHSSILTMKNYQDVILLSENSNKEGYIRNLKHTTKSLEEAQKTSKRKDKSTLGFLLGFYYQQLAFYAQHKEEIKGLLIKSHCHYQNCIKLRHGENESHYYSQLQIGLLQQALDYPWFEIQQSYLKAYTIDPIRGESIKEIIKYYISSDQWPAAYIFSSFSRAHFYGQNPFLKRKWTIDHAFYNWKILNYHTVICCHLGKWKEAKATSDILLQQIEQCPDYFTQRDIEIIQNNAKIFSKIG